MAISETPGNFNVSENCKTSSRDTSLEWDTTRTSDTACQLKKNTTYYWNITFTDGLSSGNTSCTSDCYAGLVINNPDFEKQ